MTSQAHGTPPINAETAETTRLYISPLSPDLLQAVLPKHLRSTISDISFHTLQTFPEKPFAYITLAAAEAPKLKSRLNGLTLRGVKMRVEESRPERGRKRKADHDSNGVADDARKAGDTDSARQDVTDRLERKERRRLRKKAERENGVIEAVELPEGRSVKRGWSGAKSNDKKRSKGEGDKGEMVYRTSLPPNVASQAKDSTKSSKKSKKDKADSKGRKSVEVTEFTNTTKYPSFLRDNKVSNGTKRATEFVKGKGWIDEDGNIVEATERRSKRHRTDAQPLLTQIEEERQVATPAAAVSEKEQEPTPDEIESPDETAPSNSPTPAIAAPKPVHPLEALFKRPALKSADKGVKTSRPAPIKTSFSFFSSEQDDGGGGGGDADSEGPASMAPPQTPFSRQDMEMRTIRSAAPTPDTAAIGERFRMPWRQSTADSSEGAAGNKGVAGKDEASEDDENDERDATDDDDDDDDLAHGDDAEGNEPAEADPSAAADGGAQEQNDFEKHFWEQRGHYNRAWKARQREARKEVRQRENRRRGVAR